MGIFERKKRPGIESLPAVLIQPEDPVNYNSVLDYMVGLSDKEYKQMTASAEIYRKANKDVAKVIGVKDEPTTTIASTKPSDDEIDEGLNQALSGDYIATDEPEAPKPAKKQAPAKKIEVS